MKSSHTIIVALLLLACAFGIASAAVNPSCNFTATPQSGIEDLTVTFTATYEGISPPVTYKWDFGDGSGADKISGSSITHTYLEPGKYSVRLEVNDIGIPTTWWISNTKTDFISVYHELPEASFTASKTSMVGGIGTGDVNFVSTSTGYIESYEWFIDDRSYGPGDTLSTTFPWVNEPETHTVILRAIGDGGFDNSTPLIVTVNPMSPNPYFDALSTVGVKPFTAAFTSIPGGYGVTSYNWDFGDGQTGTGQNPVHTYMNTGVYSVSLIVDAGIYGTGTVTRSSYITVLNSSTDVCPIPEPTPIPTIPPVTILPDNVGVFRPSSGNWYLNVDNAGTVATTFHYGATGDIPVTGDFNGDGVTDTAVFRPGSGTWYVDEHADGMTYILTQFGKLGDVPLAGDFNADGRSDFVIFRPSTGNWYIDNNHDGNSELSFHFGTFGDIPVIGNWAIPT